MAGLWWRNGPKLMKGPLNDIRSYRVPGIMWYDVFCIKPLLPFHQFSNNSTLRSKNRSWLFQVVGSQHAKPLAAAYWRLHLPSLVFKPGFTKLCQTGTIEYHLLSKHVKPLLIQEAIARQDCMQVDLVMGSKRATAKENIYTPACTYNIYKWWQMSK